MFLDTSGLLCLLHKAELLHPSAHTLYKQARVRFTHNYVLAEFVALATVRKLPRTAILSYLEDLVRNPDITTIWIDESVHQKAMSLLLERQDKRYSLCDAVSFIVMKQYNIQEALTTDHHFEQEGFIKLLLHDG